MILPTLFYKQGEPCYPLKFWLFDNFKMLYAKRYYMSKHGWFRTMSDDWRSEHLEFLPYHEYRNMNLEELKSIVK